MSKVPHLLKGSALPDGEQRRLAEYASAHPKSALHRKGQHHDAAVCWFTVSATRITARRSRILASRWRIVGRLCWL